LCIAAGGRWLTRRCGSVAYQNMLEGTIPDAMRTLSQLTRLYCPSFLLEAFPPSPLLLTVPSVHHFRTAPTEGPAFHVASRQTRLRFSDGRQAELVCSLR
jgi:hypothetical protein